MQRLLPFFCVLAIVITLACSARRTNASDDFAQFHAVPFGSSREHTRLLMLHEGFRFDSAGTHENDLFIGSIDGTRTDLWAYYDDEQQVAKIVVNIETNDDAAQSTYARVKADLTTQYGKPTNSYGFVKKPYTEANTLDAIRAGKGFFSSYWVQPDGSAQLVVEMTSMLTVQVTYEGPNWVNFFRAHSHEDPSKAESTSP